MSQILSSRQAEELYVTASSFRLNLLRTARPCPAESVFANLLLDRHKAIIAYLTSINFHDTAAALRREASIGDEFDEATRKKYEGLLEKKWTSVVRLQKKV